MEIDAFPLKRSTNLKQALELLSLVRDANEKTVCVAIGKQCSLFRSPVAGFDYTIGGEPENYIVNFFIRLSKGELLAPYINVGLIDDLNTLPTPEYSILTGEHLTGNNAARNMRLAASALFETSRGCPGICSFCQRKGWGKKVRFFSQDKTLQVYQRLLDEGIRNFWITDDNFAANLTRAKELLKAMSRCHKTQDVKIALSAWTKIDTEFLQVAKDAGVSLISFGLESVVPSNQRFFNKPIDQVQVLEILDTADQIGIYTVGNFIIGTPTDTEDTIRQSFDFAVKSALDEINVKILDYMIGSELYDSLPDDLKKDNPIHMFASQEAGVCNFPLEVLRKTATLYTRKFKFSRANKFIEKSKRVGSPYFIADATGGSNV